ncbi:TetR/AcrR family transcriptional regulator [Nocardioides donggukensis]|uniref:TetR/AcrR family transcriptional regulator C-terminal domain-containing protein n=1 Tax=Nocardioides donggukensis TaxID=2774019 RepID=A0A927K5L4_9ACTN|nr:TetR/AcrR family transcriptional regulator [Nocardioides donggukensis]MBD8870336.1 TetR/AcrR family transcriptional regulator C-terminal domain-containing protein [Nocardioides donggukensis]
MAARTDGRQARGTLTRDGILAAAVELADREGRDGRTSLTMRSLARHLGVEAMSLYHHVTHKEDLLDGMVDVLFAEIHLPRAGADWMEEIRRRCRSGREVLARHPWAVGLMDSRSTPGPATLRHHDAVLGCLRSGGFSVPMAAHAFAVLDAHLYGFMVQEVSMPMHGPEETAALAELILAGLPEDSYPHLRELTEEHVLQPGYDFGAEFDYGLDLVLEGLERRRVASLG